MGKSFYYNKNDKEVGEILKQAGIDTRGMTEDQMVNMVNVAAEGARKIKKAINRPVRKVKLASINGLYFYEKNWSGFELDESNHNYRLEITRYISDELLWIYMLDMLEFKVDDDFFEITDEKYLEIDRDFIDAKSSDCLHMSRELRKNVTSNVMLLQWKLVSDNYIGYFFITDRSYQSAQVYRDYDSSSVDTSNAPQFYTFEFYKFDLKRKIMTVSMFALDPNDPKYHKPVINGNMATPVYIGKERDIETYINSSMGYTDSFNQKSTVVNIMTIYRALSILCEHTNYMEKHHTEYPEYMNRPSYTGFEMKILNRVFNLYDDPRHRSLDILTYGKKENITSGRHYDTEINPSVPKVDFSQKELEFSRNYLLKTSIVGGEKKVDFVDILENPRWGDQLILPARNIIPDQITPVLCTYKYFKKENEVDFNLAVIDEYGLTGMTFSFGNVNKFDLKDSFNAMRLYYLPNPDEVFQLPSDYEGYKGLVPEKLNDIDFMLSIIADVISIYVIINERPDRSKMIRETRRVEKPAAKGKKGKAAKPEVEYVVRRILKPVKEAKEYIAKMSTEGERNVEYTMESWTRKEHKRRKPGTKDEYITIQATTCHRHKELSGKEVHLKL